MFGENFFAWKLSSFWDYFGFFSVIAIGAAGFYFAYLKLKKARTNEVAIDRVVRKLKKRKLRGAVVLSNVKLTIKGQEVKFDAVVVDKKGLMPVRVIGSGLKVYGTQTEENWRIKDKFTDLHIPNPIIEFKKSEALLTQHFGNNGVYGTNFEPLIIMADTFDTPHAYTDQGTPIIPLIHLKQYMKNRKSLPDIKSDYKKIAEMMTKA